MAGAKIGLPAFELQHLVRYLRDGLNKVLN